MSTNCSSYQLSIEVKTPKGFKVICVRDILYIKSVRKCSIIYFYNTDNIITYHLLRWYENYLLEPFFFRCHNSYLVNCQFVDFYCHKEITLKNQNKIPLSRNNFGIFKENLKCLLIEIWRLTRVSFNIFCAKYSIIKLLIPFLFNLFRFCTNSSN